MPIHPRYFRPLQRRKMSLLHWLVQTIMTVYFLCRGGLTLQQAKRIWSGKARLAMHDPYDDMEYGPGPH